jgi:hypothetical protein
MWSGDRWYWKSTRRIYNQWHLIIALYHHNNPSHEGRLQCVILILMWGVAVQLLYWCCKSYIFHNQSVKSRILFSCSRIYGIFDHISFATLSNLLHILFHRFQAIYIYIKYRFHACKNNILKKENNILYIWFISGVYKQSGYNRITV